MTQHQPQLMNCSTIKNHVCNAIKFLVAWSYLNDINRFMMGIQAPNSLNYNVVVEVYLLVFLVIRQDG